MAVRILVLALALLAGASPLLAQAQPTSPLLHGQVIAADGFAPIPDVVITVVEANRNGLTNLDGRYLILLDSSDVGRTVTVTASQSGYEVATDTITLVAGRQIVNFLLTASPWRIFRGDSIQAAAHQPGTLGRAEAAGAYEQLNVRGLAVIAPTTFRDGPGMLPGDREAYAPIDENDFRAVSVAPLSTFSIDVDRASYANTRRFLMDGELPPRDAVRIEELINYFPYDDPSPDGAVPFAITTEFTTAPWAPAHRLLRIALKGRSVDMADAPPANLVFLMDVSGSMNSADKLPLLKTAFRLLVESLRPDDRVAIVVYAGAAGVVLESTPASEKPTILDAIERLRAGGSTAGGAGIRLAYDIAAEHHVEGGNNRVILATDGDFNVGASSDSEMVQLIEEKREQGTFLTVLGFGTGNLQDAKMEQIADHGNGNFHYIDSALEARKSLVAEAGGTLVTIAKDVKIQVEFNPTTVAGYRLIGYENRLLADEDFNDDTKDAGELGAGHSVVALYEIVPAGAAVPRGPDVDPLRYSDPVEPVGIDTEAAFVKLRYKEPDGDESLLLTQPVMNRPVQATTETRWAAAVAAFGMLLRESEHVGDFRWSDVVSLAREARGDDPHGYRAEFLRLAEMAGTLMSATEGLGSR